jgi:hypothetical protein
LPMLIRPDHHIFGPRLCGAMAVGTEPQGNRLWHLEAQRRRPNSCPLFGRDRRDSAAGALGNVSPSGELSEAEEEEIAAQGGGPVDRLARHEAASASLTTPAEAAISARWCRNVTHSGPLASSSTVMIGCTATLARPQATAWQQIGPSTWLAGGQPSGASRDGVLSGRRAIVSEDCRAVRPAGRNDVRTP